MFKYQSRPSGVTFSRSEMASKSNGNKVEDDAKQAKGKFRFNLVHFVVDHHMTSLLSLADTSSGEMWS